MKANELRVGNWVFFDSDSFSEQVRLKTFAILEKYPESIASIKPIRLTPEILEQCGFESDTDFGGHVFESHLGVSIGIEDNGLCYYMGNLEPLWVDVLQEIKYLHQLQNLYFALTGTELEYNPIKETV